MNKYLLELTDQTQEYHWKVEINLGKQRKRVCKSCQIHELNQKKQTIWSSVKRTWVSWEAKALDKNNFWNQLEVEYYCEKHTKADFRKFKKELENSSIVLLNPSVLEEIRKEVDHA